MYIKKLDRLNYARANIDPTILGNTIYYDKHPAYTSFLVLNITNDQGSMNMAWKALLDGFKHQLFLNEVANTTTINTENEFKNLLSTLKNKEMNDIYLDNFRYFKGVCDYLYSIGKGITSIKFKNAKDNYDSFIRNVIRCDNEHFISFANILQSGLCAQGGKEIALWSGGIDLSTLAWNCNKNPLEKTILGHFLDTTELISNWACEAPLWNIISRKFIGVNNTSVHVYFRTIDDTSVLMRQEIPYYRNTHTCDIYWHPIVTSGRELSEVGTDGSLINIDPRNQGITNQKEAITKLGDKIRQLQLQNQKVYLESNSECFQPNHAPFALIDDISKELIDKFLNSGSR